MDTNPYAPPRETDCVSNEDCPQSPKPAVSIVEILLLFVVWVALTKNNVGVAVIVGVVVLAIFNAVKRSKWNRTLLWAYGLAALAIFSPVDIAAMRDGSGPGVSFAPIHYVGRGIDGVKRDLVVRHINLFFDYPRRCVVVNLP